MRVRVYVLPVILFLVAAWTHPAFASPYKFVVGERSSYQIEYKSKSSADISALFNSKEKTTSARSLLKQAFTTTVKGTFTITFVETKDEGFAAAIRFVDSEVSLSADGQNAAADAANIKSDLEKPIFALLSPQGKIISVLLDANIGKTSRGYIMSLLSLVQFVFPENDEYKVGKWRVPEEGPNGSFIAAYSRQKPKKGTIVAESSTIFSKTKIRYLPQPKKSMTRTIEIETTIIPKGKLIARFDFANGRVTSISGAESENFLINKKSVGHSKNTINFSFQSKERVGEDEISSLKAKLAEMSAANSAIPLSAKASAEERERASFEKDLGDSTLEGLLADLKSAQATAGPKFDYTPLFLKFRALVYLHPETCVKIGEVLGNAEADSLTMKVLSTALNSIGSPEAQAALVSAVRKHSADEKTLFKLLFMLSTVEKPTMLAEDALRDLAYGSPNPNIKTMARLSLGSMARRLINTEPQRASIIVKTFMHDLSSSSSFDSKKQSLLALGNAGSDEALPSIEPFTKDSDPNLRAVAVRALRFMKITAAQDLIIKALTSDPEANVRLEAANALAKREITPEAYKAQRDSFLNEKNANIRLAVMRNLWKVRDDFPEVRKIIKKAASKDRSKDVQKAAASLLKNAQ